MTKNQDGPTFFGSPPKIPAMEVNPALTLRDYFAAAALAEVPDPTSVADAPTTAKLAYAIADAMLAERAKPTGGDNG